MSSIIYRVLRDGIEPPLSALQADALPTELPKLLPLYELLHSVTLSPGLNI